MMHITYSILSIIQKGGSSLINFVFHYDHKMILMTGNWSDFTLCPFPPAVSLTGHATLFNTHTWSNSPAERL